MVPCWNLLYPQAGALTQLGPNNHFQVKRLFYNKSIRGRPCPKLEQKEALLAADLIFYSLQMSHIRRPLQSSIPTADFPWQEPRLSAKPG